MTNKEIIKNYIEKNGYTLGCYDSDLEKLTKAAMKKMFDEMTFDYQDIEATIRRKKYIIEVCNVDGEIDLQILDKDEYDDRYGY